MPLPPRLPTLYKLSIVTASTDYALIKALAFYIMAPSLRGDPQRILSAQVAQTVAQKEHEKH